MSELILNNLNIAIVCVDEKLNVSYLNQAAEHLLEVSGNRAIGLKFSSIILNPHELDAYIFDTSRTGQTYTKRKVKLNLVTNRIITCDYAISPLNRVNDSEVGQVLIELYPLDRYLRIDRDESLTTHTEVTRQMVRGLAHEIKNPLGGIRGSAQLLARELQKLPSEEPLEQYTDVIIDETDRLTSLVDRLLGPKSLPKPEHINVHEVLERVRTLIELEATPKINIQRDYDPSIPDLFLDPELLVQVVLNIARNAMQSLQSTEEPSLTFRTRVERQFTIGVKKHKLIVRISIIDNGPGIPESLKEHLFFPMISGRSNGTGLGLSVAQAIIHQHHGLIEFESDSKLTNFSIILPLELTS